MDDYDVFLNHRGPDVKGGFIAHLDDALRSAGLNPFLDKKSLVKGHPAFSSIDAALEVAKVHVAVVSQGYAESKYCLNELVAIMRSGKPVIPVFYDVEPAHLRRVQSGPFAAAFQKHKYRERAEQVEEWADALRKLADITGFCFGLSDYERDEVELNREVVDAIISNLAVSTNEALHVERHLVGLGKHMKICLHKLEKMSGGIGLLCLVGMGGIGKTSLAKEIYNHLVGHLKFQFMSFLEIDRSSPSNMEVGRSLLSRLQKQLLWDLLNVPNNTRQSYKYWFHKLSRRGPILVVIDDLHDKSQFDNLILDLTILAPGSYIIVTSRDRHLLKVVGRDFNFYLHEVTTLSPSESKMLFNWHAFRNDKAPKSFEALAHVVSEACGGLPLALKVVGSSLFDKRSNEDRECIWSEAVEVLRGNRDVMSILRWSYNSLSKSEKLMFVDIACVFHGWEKKKAIEVWKSCKKCTSCCCSQTPHTSLRHLIDKSLVLIENKRGELAMHGLLREMGQEIGRVDGTHFLEGRIGKSIVDNNQGTNKVRALNLGSILDHKIEAKRFAKMSNLHFLILDGCEISGDLESVSRELRWLQWRNMPWTHLPAKLSLCNLTSLDFSYSTKLANTWAESNPSLEACPNMLRLDLTGCTSITELPNSICHLSRLQKLNLTGCTNLQKLPSSIGELTMLHTLQLTECRSLEALPDTISALSNLQRLFIRKCPSISKLPTTIGLLTALWALNVCLNTEWQAVGIGQLNALGFLTVAECTDEIITFLDSSGILGNLNQLRVFVFWLSQSITKLPETIGLLTNLEYLQIKYCEKLQELPNSIGQLKKLMVLILFECRSLETLPDSLGALRSLQLLSIHNCTSITKLPDSVRQLNALRYLRISGCGSVEGLGVPTTLQGLRIWGCTSITELPGSWLVVRDVTNYHGPSPLLFTRDYVKEIEKLRNYEELGLLEANDCGSVLILKHPRKDRSILLRAHELPCCKLGAHVE